jgi:hypothetical protein
MKGHFDKIVLFAIVPVLAALSCLLHLEFLAFGGYVVVTRLFAPFWFDIASKGYRAPPSGSLRSVEFKFSNRWQVLLFPARISEDQRASALDAFHEYGFRKWEGRAAAFFCAFAVTGDLLDGFDDDYGLPLSQDVVYSQFFLFIAWNALLAAVFFLTGHTVLAGAAASLAVFEAIGVTFFLVMDHRKWSRLSQNFQIRSAQSDASP